MNLCEARGWAKERDVVILREGANMMFDLVMRLERVLGGRRTSSAGD